MNRNELWLGAAQAALWANASPDNLDTEQCLELAEDRSLWTPKGVEAIDDVLDWIDANEADVRSYMAITNRNEHEVGHDFSLSRARHGTGLWDRGAGEVGERLHKAAIVYGSGDLFCQVDSFGWVCQIDGA